MAPTEGVVWGMFRAGVAATASLEQCSSAASLYDEGGTCLTLGHQKNEFQILPLSRCLPSFLSVDPSVTPSRTSEAPHSHLHNSLVHTSRNQKLTDFSSIPGPAAQQYAEAWSPSDYLQCCLYTEGVHYPSFLAFLAPSSLYSPRSSLPLHAPLPLFSPEKLFCLIHLH